MDFASSTSSSSHPLARSLSTNSNSASSSLSLTAPLPTIAQALQPTARSALQSTHRTPLPADYPQLSAPSSSIFAALTPVGVRAPVPRVDVEGATPGLSPGAYATPARRGAGEGWMGLNLDGTGDAFLGIHQTMLTPAAVAPGGSGWQAFSPDNRAAAASTSHNPPHASSIFTPDHLAPALHATIQPTPALSTPSLALSGPSSLLSTLAHASTLLPSLTPHATPSELRTLLAHVAALKLQLEASVHPGDTTPTPATYAPTATATTTVTDTDTTTNVRLGASAPTSALPPLTSPSSALSRTLSGLDGERSRVGKGKRKATAEEEAGWTLVEGQGEPGGFAVGGAVLVEGGGGAKKGLKAKVARAVKEVAGKGRGKKQKVE